MKTTFLDINTLAAAALAMLRDPEDEAVVEAIRQGGCATEVAVLRHIELGLIGAGDPPDRWRENAKTAFKALLEKGVLIQQPDGLQVV